MKKKGRRIERGVYFDREQIRELTRLRKTMDAHSISEMVRWAVNWWLLQQRKLRK